MIIMALTENTQNYIDELTPLVKKYAKIYGYSPAIVPVIVAQSCYETGYRDMSNVFRPYNKIFKIIRWKKSNTN